MSAALQLPQYVAFWCRRIPRHKARHQVPNVRCITSDKHETEAPTENVCADAIFNILNTIQASLGQISLKTLYNLVGSVSVFDRLSANQLTPTSKCDDTLQGIAVAKQYMIVL